MNTTKNYFTMLPNANFLNELASFVLEKYSASETITKLLILLPNRRACRALRDAFLDCSGGKPLLLPRIQPIGEVEDETFFLTSPDDIVEQPIDSVRRHFLLTKLVMQFQQQQAGGGVRQAFELAKGLAEFIDEVNRESLDFEGLSSLAPENLANHWQQTLDFLEIISRKYPQELALENASDAVTYRNKTILDLCKNWKENPPNYPIIAAGSTGSQPATAQLLKTIANLSQGMVILPPLDKEMNEKEWEQIADTHPQFMLKKLLQKLEIERADVRILSPCNSQGDKELCIRTIFSPPLATANWATINIPAETALNHIKLLETDTLLDEARAIAIAFRTALETPQKTVALITPDRTLARMVCAIMHRFGVSIDDSAGKPLSQSAPACFMRLAIEMVASRFAPATLLALLRHPFASCGLSPAKCRKLSRELELSLLRGIRRKDGLKGLQKAATSPELAEFLSILEEKTKQIQQLFLPNYIATVSQLLTKHIELCEFLASGEEQQGAEVLWSGDAGNALAEIIAQWNSNADILPAIDPLTYPALFDSLLAMQTYHSNAGLHPRLHILSPMEARLQNYDMVILSGLNEDTWPKRSESSPWISRPQRAEFGLPSYERAIGQSAYDFSLQLFAQEVLLTRARKIEGTPTVPSRWLVRLKTLLSGKNHEFLTSLNQDNYFRTAQNILEKPTDIVAISAPAPCPAITARPRKLRVTAIDEWLRDPYVIYAKYILKLKKLEKLDREPDASDFGNIIHKALDSFTRAFPSILPEDAIEKLLEHGNIAFAEFIDRPSVACLWLPRFETMANWLIISEKIRRDNLQTIYSEIEGNWELMIDDKPFIISTRIDRLELQKDGNYTLIDYKTGAVPLKKHLAEGLANQLPLCALIVELGKLTGEITPSIVEKMEYWKMSGSENKCEIIEIELDKQQTKTRVEELIHKFNNPSQAYNAQIDANLLRYNDCEHLTRRKEWEAV